MKIFDQKAVGFGMTIKAFGESVEVNDQDFTTR